jgi:hypothetical protein
VRNRAYLAWLLGCACVVHVNGTRFIEKVVLNYPEHAHFSYDARDFLADFARTNFNLVSKQSLVLVSAFAPVYAAARAIDDHLHDGLYDHRHHKNLFCSGSYCKPFVDDDIGLVIPFVGLSLGQLLSSDPQNKVTGSLLLSGMVSVIIAKFVIKELTRGHEWCRRPYCERFEKKIKYGGFPSGHTATATYMTLFFAFRKGIRWAFPIGVYSGILAGLSVACNCHYASQVVAGIGLGALYAVAAHKVAQDRLQENWSIDCSIDGAGRPSLRVSYAF